MHFLRPLCASLICGLVLVGVASAQESDTADIVSVIEINPQVSTRELSFALVPLTKEELNPLPYTLPGIVRAEKWAIPDKQVALTHQMKEAFDAEGISIPYKQRDIQIKTQAG